MSLINGKSIIIEGRIKIHICECSNGARLKANDNMMRFMHYIWMKYITDTGFNNEGLKVEFQRKVRV